MELQHGKNLFQTRRIFNVRQITKVIDVVIPKVSANPETLFIHNKFLVCANGEIVYIGETEYF